MVLEAFEASGGSCELLMPYTSLRLHTTVEEPTFGDFRKSGFFFRRFLEVFRIFRCCFEGSETSSINSALEHKIPHRMVVLTSRKDGI